LGGTAITITGTNLTGASSVTVGGVAATSVVVVSSTSITAVTPAGTAGAKTVAVTTAGGTASLTNGFTYVAPAPTVSSVSPTSGSTLGGTAITITGTNLTGASSVTVGGVAATSVVVVSPTSITAVTPASTAGAKTVAVTTAGGTATLTNGFTYVVPSVWYTVIQQTVDAAVVTNVAMRNAITASGLPWRVRDTATQMEMLLVPAGTFVMGCTAANQSGCLSSENPTHSVTLTQAFYLGRYEVTQGQWVAKMGSNPSVFQGASYPDAANRPVEQVSWTTIQSYVSANGMRLPSEAEWEYACRAGTTTAFNNGSSDDATVGNIAWYNQNSGSQTHVVGGKAANALGLFDMSGNVSEWVNDWYGSYSVSPSTNPLGPVSGTARVLRGGSWLGGPDGVRSSSRGFNAPANTPDTVGFRVARDAPPPPAPTVSSVSPTSGSTSGGTAITITGTNLTGASSVTVGGVAATSVWWFLRQASRR
jgi:formylglycine-generating enzyme required for sulfatase activity